MEFPLWTILVGAIGLIWFLRRRQAKKEKFKNLKPIPGPRGLPIVGNLLQFDKDNSSRQAREWSEKYGEIYKINFLGQNAVFVSDPKWVKEMFNDPAFNGKMILSTFQVYEDTPELGIIMSEGEKWEVHRRFLLRQLRDFGFGKSSMESLIVDEINELIENYKKSEGTPVGQIKLNVRLAVVNSLWSILTSKRFRQDDPQLLRLSNIVSDTFNEAVMKGGFLIFIPWLTKLFPEKSGYNYIRSVLKEIQDFLEETLKEKKRDFKEEEANDFIDVYLAEMKKADNDPKSQFHGKVAERQLVHILFDLFFAGTDTTSSTLAWTVLYLCKFPEAQKKLQQEISEATTGDSRKASVADRPNMPYTLALIDEVLRYSSLVQDGVQHCAMVDKEFHGYLIEKGTIIQPSLYYIHHDPKIWGDPENFRPERFLSADGKKYVRNENMMGFQAGRRQCVGETLARDSLFLFITYLFQQFEMKFNPNEPEPSLEAELGFLRNPRAYSVIMTDRLKK